ncbi:MAG: hypothetical protein RL514_3670 [Verrucomicrobiota bacterium]|jgi:TPR repeat protein
MTKFLTPLRLGNGLVHLTLALATALLLAVNHAVVAAPALSPSAPTIRSFAELRAAAERGDVIAQRLLGHAYLGGEGVTQDLAEGARWVRAAALQRDARAQYVLGTLYDQGEGVTADLREAVKWYELAAQQGLPDAQYNVALCYLKGEGVLKDSKKAFEWFRKAAEQDDARSQCNVGLAYINGNGVEKDLVEASRWLRRAAYPPGEDARAQFLLGRLYQLGQGVEQDLKEATKWIRKAAVQNFPGAQFDYGRALLVGEGTERNETEGRAWIEKAAAQGHELAKQHLGQGGRPAPAAPTALAAVPEKSPMTAAATGFTPTKPTPGTFVPLSYTGKEPALTPPPPEASTSLNAASALREREPLPAIPTLPPPGKAMEVPPPPAFTKSAPPGTTAKELSLPPFTAPPAPVAPAATKEPAPAPSTPDFFRLPPGGAADTNAGGILNEPARTREPVAEPRGRELTAPLAAPAAGGSDANWVPIISMLISALILFLGVAMLVIFKTRLQGLESELKKAQFELSKANVNLSSMMHQVEQLALMAPTAAPKTSLPEWNATPAKGSVSSFKINRSK